MQYKDIESLTIIYGKKKHMDGFINYFHEFFERDGENLQCLRIKNNPHSWFNDLKHFIWNGD